MGQTNGPACPSISINFPNTPLSAKHPETISATLSGKVGPEKIYYLWATTAGEISGEFGSPSIQLSVKKYVGSITITVFVRVEGLPADCPNTASDRIGTIQVLEGDPYDRFGEPSRNGMKERIDNFCIVLKDNPASEGVIAVYFNKNKSDMHKLRNLRSILDAVRSLKHDITRLSFSIAEGSGSTQFTLWIVPPGADVSDLSRAGEPITLIKGEDVIKDLRKALPKKKTCKC